MQTHQEEDQTFSEIILSLVTAIKNGDPADEIRDMIINCNNFKRAIKYWKEPESRLNVLQIAVIEGDPEVVKTLRSLDLQFEYQYVKENVPDIPLSSYDAYKLRIKNLHRSTKLEKSEFDTSTSFWKDSAPHVTYTRINNPLHLACYHGNMAMVNVLLPPVDDVLEMKEVLQERSILKLMNTQKCIDTSAATNCTASNETLERCHYYRDPNECVNRKKLLVSNSAESNSLTGSTGSSLIEGKTLLDVCVEENHLDCAMHVAHLMSARDIFTCCQPFLQGLNFEFGCADLLPLKPNQQSEDFNKKNISVVNESSLELVIACILKSPSYLTLLLENSYLEAINTPCHKGYPPLHAALAADEKCMKVLLEHGARPNYFFEHQGPLNWLFHRSLRDNTLIEKLKLLLQYNVDVNTRDRNGNTVLDCILFNVALNEWWDTENSNQQPLIMTCTKMLLEHGAQTLVRSNSGVIHHTLGHTLLLNLDRHPLARFPNVNAKHLHAMLDLLFQFGLDPNVLPTRNESSLFSEFICLRLKSLESSTQKMLVHFFIMNGARVNELAQATHNHHHSRPIKIWNVPPVIMALQELIPMETIAVFCHYMFLKVLNECIVLMSKDVVWRRIDSIQSGEPPSLTNTAMSSTVSKYKTEWDQLVEGLQNARSLKHLCKLRILGSVQWKEKLVETLTLPRYLKKYVCCLEC